MDNVPDVLKDRNLYVVKRSLLARDLILETNPKTVLDIGCRAGIILSLLNKNIEMHGVDLIERIECVPDYVHYKQADVSRGVPYGDDMFDVVNGSEIIEHVTDTALFLSECFRILKKGGRLVLSTPNLHYWRNLVEWLKGNQFMFIDYRDGQEGHVRYFCPKTITEMTQQAGFQNIHVSTVGDVGADNILLKCAAKCFERFSKNKNCIIIVSAEKS